MPDERTAPAAGGASETMANAQSKIAEAGDTTIASVRKTLAAIQGAIEGLEEEMRREDLGREAGRAAAEAKATAHAVREEARVVAEDPTMRRAGAAVSRGVDTVKHRAESAGETVGERVAEVRHAVAEKAHEARATVQHAAEDVKHKAAAVAETGKRATHAPGAIAKDVKQGVSGWFSKMATAAGYYGAAGVLGIVFLVLFAIWLTVALNELLGDPWGTLVSALIFLAAAGIAVWLGTSSARDAPKEMAEARRRVREDVDYVTEPVRREFRGARRET